MASPFSATLGGDRKFTKAAHRFWQCNVLANGKIFPRVIGRQIASAADIYRLGIMPAFNFATVTTAAGTSTPGIFGTRIVYRSTLFNDGLSSENIRGNGSNIIDVDLSAGTLAAVATKVVSTDTKVDKIDIYAAQKIGSVYGTFYRVVKDAANTAGTVTFSIVLANGVLTGVTVTNGTADTTGRILDIDNDFPGTQPILLEVAGRLAAYGGITNRVTATFMNGSATVSTAEQVFDGIEFFFIKRDSDTTGGVDSRGTYLCRYATSMSVTLVNVDGTAALYAGANGTETTSIWTEANERVSKLYNPHAFPIDNIGNEFPTAVLAAEKVPNSNRVLVMGKNYVIARDFDRFPFTEGLNVISTEYGCASQFSITSAHGRLYWLDLSGDKREILFSDGTTVQPISTIKIKSILRQVTLDSNGEAWRIEYIDSAYYPNEEVIRWGLYLSNSTVANFILELDLITGEVRADPTWNSHRYLDVFTYGKLRGRVFIGQFGWSGGLARIGLDNVDQRYRDWVEGGTLSGALAAAGQTTTVLTTAAGGLYTTGDGLKGIQVMVWRENDAQGILVTNPTYYHCRISANDATTFTVNYVETVNSVGTITAVGIVLPVTPSGTGWKWAVGVIQAMVGPKWLVSKDARTDFTVREITVNHGAQKLVVAESPVRVHHFENFDRQPRGVDYLEPVQEGVQVADATKSASSFSRPKTNPSVVQGFSIVDNNVNTDTTALNIETITISTNDQPEAQNSQP